MEKLPLRHAVGPAGDRAPAADCERNRGRALHKNVSQCCNSGLHQSSMSNFLAVLPRRREPPASRSTLDDARDQWPAVEARATTAQSSAAASRLASQSVAGSTPAEAGTAAHAAGEAEADLETCAVCMDAKASVRFRPCGHDACPECVVKLRRRTMSQVTAGTVCPLCRQVILEYVVPNGVYVGSQPAPPPAVGLARKVLPPRLEATPLAAPAARRGAPASRPERLDLPGDGMQSFVPTANFRTKLCPNWSQACMCFPRLFFVHGVLSVAVILAGRSR